MTDLVGTRPPVTGRADPDPLQVLAVSRRFGAKEALRSVSMSVKTGGIHAVLGPNGAGKTTLLRIIVGLTDPDGGEIRLGGEPVRRPRPRGSRRFIGLVPSGDRTLYLRISGLENLIFFGRLAGLRKREAVRRAEEQLERVGLADVAGQRVHTYSHGMQKRLSIARAFLTQPAVLLFDEATHDIDPLGTRQIQDLVREAARDGAAVVWATQRIEEVRGFCDRVTLLHRGTVRFEGSVSGLIAHGISRRYVLNVGSWKEATLESGRRALAGAGTLERAQGHAVDDHIIMTLDENAVLGDAIAALSVAGIRIHACRQERAEVEDAFLALTEDEA
jgi:ABC-type multidrug transport system ATPase subunit